MVITTSGRDFMNGVKIFNKICAKAKLQNQSPYQISVQKKVTITQIFAFSGKILILTPLKMG